MLKERPAISTAPAVGTQTWALRRRCSTLGELPAYPLPWVPPGKRLLSVMPRGYQRADERQNHPSIKSCRPQGDFGSEIPWERVVP